MNQIGLKTARAITDYRAQKNNGPRAKTNANLLKACSGLWQPSATE